MTTSSENNLSGLDLTKLSFVRSGPNGTKIAQCPVCASLGRDSKNKNHLTIFPDGKWNCIVDSDHNSGVWALAGINSDTPIFTEIKQPTLTPLQVWPVTILNDLIKEFSYWEKRGISRQTQDLFEMGVAYKGKLAGRVVNGIFNREKTQIIGFAGRSIDNKEPRWKILGAKREFLYPFWLAKEHILASRSIILVEGIGCCLTLWEHGIRNVICLFGTKLSSRIIGLLIELNLKEIVLALNNESSSIGLDAANEAKSVLSQFFDENKIKVHLPFKKDFNEMNAEEIKQWSQANA